MLPHTVSNICSPRVIPKAIALVQTSISTVCINVVISLLPFLLLYLLFLLQPSSSCSTPSSSSESVLPLPATAGPMGPWEALQQRSPFGGGGGEGVPQCNLRCIIVFPSGTVTPGHWAVVKEPVQLSFPHPLLVPRITIMLSDTSVPDITTDNGYGWST